MRLETTGRWLAPGSVFALHLFSFIALAWWSWLKWPDPLIDFGRELYVPWQITRGKVLFRDIESVFGPLSPYVNALWFRLFGVSVLSLVAANLAIFGAVVAGVHRLLRLSTDRFTATVGSLLTMAMFGFLQLGIVGNYNFITPYSHEATHGIVLSVAMLLALYEAVSRRSLGAAALAGLALGLVLLTKPETSVAAAAAAVAGLVATASLGGTDRRFLISVSPAFVAAAAAPAFLFFAYFHQHMDGVAALSGVSRCFTSALNGRATHNAFYSAVMGLDRPLWNTLWMLVAFVGFVVYVTALSVACRGAEGATRSARLRRICGLFLVTLAPFGMVLGFARALPLVALAGAATAFAGFIRNRHQRTQAMRVFPLLTWSMFALVLIGKLGLRGRVSHYGFYLALPAMTIVVTALCWFIPRLLDTRRAAGSYARFRPLSALVIFGALAPYLALSNSFYRDKTLTVGSGADRFRAFQTDRDWRGAALGDALPLLQSLSGPGDALAVLPEGAMLNYLARLDSPLRFVNVMPPELALFGEDQVLRALVAARPRFIVLIHKNMTEYGYPTFGSDRRYGLRTYSWLDGHYRTLRAFTEVPGSLRGYGLEILEWGQSGESRESELQGDDDRLYSEVEGLSPASECKSGR